MNITLVINSLSAVGGAERVLSIMANYWAEKGWNVTVATFDDGSKPLAYSLNGKVKHEPLGVAKDSSSVVEGILANKHRVNTLKKFFRVHSKLTLPYNA